MKRIDPILSGTEIDRLGIAADRIEQEIEELIFSAAAPLYINSSDRRAFADTLGPQVKQFLFDHFRLIRR